MMISQSEQAGGKAARANAVLRLLNPGMQHVSRMEFNSLDEQKVVAESLVKSESQEAEIRLKEEMTALDERLRSQAEEMVIKVETAKDEARVESRREWERELEERMVEERKRLARVTEEFQQERSRYFVGVEMEVVKLALAIAARVLHREAKLDPLLLAGVVRVALEKVAKESTTVLRVPAGELEMWQRVFARDTDSSLQLVEDARLSVGECVLDTNVGMVELGVSAQLHEIERGFFDLLQQRPV